MKIRFSMIVLMSIFSVAAMAQTQVTADKLVYSNTNASTVSIHDPSVVLRNGTYTIWGSHLGCATSTDLINWTSVFANNSTFRKLASQGATSSVACGHADAFNVQQVVKIKNYKGEEVAFPNFNAEAYCSRYASDKNTWINGNMWAPDIIYNKDMKKWCMYLSLNGDHWSSIIILLTSTSATGPFTYQGPVVMGGFDGQSRNGVASPKVSETDYEIATGEKSFDSRYKQTDNGKFWPNCIDPCVFYDEEGELWMSYGSWSGGIFMLKLDKTNGLRDYTYTYPSDYATQGANGVSDPYFGKKIAGGYYVSGEGSYIQHIGKYYYLFMSYGGFAPDGGYDMRLFRSENPDGPYVDANGKSAVFTGGYKLNYGKDANDTRGMKLMSAYNNWGLLQNVGETAQGHNSACVDENGGAYVVYHTKFNDGTVGHQVRVRKLFTNQNGWLVASPFYYSGQPQTDLDNATEALWTEKELCGEYQLLLHPFKQNHKVMQEATSVKVTLTEDGKVTGDLTGTWSTQEGTNMMSIKLGSYTYNGIFCNNTMNGATKNGYKVSTLATVGFSAVCDAKGSANLGVPVWGYKLDDFSSLCYNYQNNSIAVRPGQLVSSHVKLLFPTVHNTTLKWTSSAPAVISETGKYNPIGLTEILPVTLTARMECGGLFWEQEYNVRAKAEEALSGDIATGLMAYYNFDEKPTYNEMQLAAGTDADKATYNKVGEGVISTLETDYERVGKVVHQYFGANGNNSYVRMPNPLLSLTANADGTVVDASGTPVVGITVSAWVKRSDANVWDALWGFFNSTMSNNSNAARLYLTGNSHIGYTDGTGNWFDYNRPDADNLSKTTYTYIPAEEWHLVTVTVGPENGVRVYVDGTNKTPKSIATNYDLGTSSLLNSKIKALPYAEIIQKVCTMKYFYLGLGSFWGSADACFDDLLIYSRELTQTDVTSLNKASNRVFDFSKQNQETDIQDIKNGQPDCQGGVGSYDLSGRQVPASSLKKGIYIMDGKKVMR